MLRLAIIRYFTMIRTEIAPCVEGAALGFFVELTTQLLVLSQVTNLV